MAPRYYCLYSPMKSHQYCTVCTHRTTLYTDRKHKKDTNRTENLTHINRSNGSWESRWFPIRTKPILQLRTTYSQSKHLTTFLKSFITTHTIRDTFYGSGLLFVHITWRSRLRIARSWSPHFSTFSQIFSFLIQSNFCTEVLWPVSVCHFTFQMKSFLKIKILLTSTVTSASYTKTKNSHWR